MDCQESGLILYLETHLTIEQSVQLFLRQFGHFRHGLISYIFKIIRVVIQSEFLIICFILAYCLPAADKQPFTGHLSYDAKNECVFKLAENSHRKKILYLEFPSNTLIQFSLTGFACPSSLSQL